MFTAGMMESREHRVNINEVEPEEFGLLVNFAYTSTVEISTANVQVFIIVNVINIVSILTCLSVLKNIHCLFGLGPASSSKPVKCYCCKRGLLSFPGASHHG